MQKKPNSIANALELGLFCIKTSKYFWNTLPWAPFLLIEIS